MEELNIVKSSSDVQLALAIALKEISSNMLAIKQIELQEKMVNNRLYVSVSKVAELLNIDVHKVRKMYKDKNCIIDGIEDGKSIKIFYDSVLQYVENTKNPNFINDAYFTNMNNVSRNAKNVSRTEAERLRCVKQK